MKSTCKPLTWRVPRPEDSDFVFQLNVIVYDGKSSTTTDSMNSLLQRPNISIPISAESRVWLRRRANLQPNHIPEFSRPTETALSGVVSHIINNPPSCQGSVFSFPLILYPSCVARPLFMFLHLFQTSHIGRIESLSRKNSRSTVGMHGIGRVLTFRLNYIPEFSKTAPCGGVSAVLSNPPFSQDSVFSLPFTFNPACLARSRFSSSQSTYVEKSHRVYLCDHVLFLMASILFMCYVISVYRRRYRQCCRAI